ncbi:hypothetical protein OUZ56_032725 [Daphnia magna]|uniref:Uncharacterized protein n=1 Tax=Daphnia magna TaxID=35525 RepID=A0ABQ9ZWY2_9CRUS|nr:hypothetical protein OUZ56_032725 [Daphnia magna]
MNGEEQFIPIFRWTLKQNAVPTKFPGCSQKPKEIKVKLRASRTNEVVSKKIKGASLVLKKVTLSSTGFL